MDKNSTLADPCCMILSNMTRPRYLVDRVITLIEESGYPWDSIVATFTAKEYNVTGANLHYLGPVFSNLTQSPSVRRYVKRYQIFNLSFLIILQYFYIII